MKTVCIVLALIAVLAPVAPAASVTPVQKVIQMLENMQAKGKAEKEAEIEEFKEVKKFCKGAAAAKVRSIEENTAVVGKLEGEIDSLNLEVDQLGADIAKADADIGVLADKIANLDSQMDNIQGEEADLTAERTEEHKVFEAKDTDYSDSVDALDRAVMEMKKVTLLQTSQQKAALIQLTADTKQKMKNPAARDAIDRWMNTKDSVSLLQTTQPTGEAAAYESQSGGIQELFEGLESKLSDERNDGQTREAEEKHTYDVMMLQLNGQLKEAKQHREKKAAAKAQAETDLAAAEGEKADTERALEEDRKYLAELKAECEAKATAFAQRQETRQGEIDAIGQATEILAGGAVAGAAGKHLPGLLQMKKRGMKKALAQLRSKTVSPAQKRAAAFLQERAKTFASSKILAEAAQKMAQAPFDKVIGMIKDMIQKLTEEANEEAEHKGFCDAELGANQATRDEKNEMIDSLNAQIEELTATENKLAQDITTLSTTVEELSSALAEATKIRNDEKDKNAVTIADAKAAIQAVGQATNVLREFYAKAAQASGGNTGQQDSASGVMSFLEVILSDFERLEEETTANEGQAADDFSAFSAETNAAVESNNADIKAKTTAKTNTAKDLMTAKTDLGNTQGELSAAMEYYEKLKPSCVDSGISYEERVQRRKEEMESLREAVKILDGTDVAV